MCCGGLVHGDPLFGILFLKVHEIPRDGAAARIHRGLPEKHQGRVPDLTERQVVGRT